AVRGHTRRQARRRQRPHEPARGGGRRSVGRRRCRAREADRGARPNSSSGVPRGARGELRSGLLGRPIPRGRRDQRRGPAGARDRAHPRRERGAGGRVPLREGRVARLLRRSGDEGDRRQGQREGRERAAPGEAEGVSAVEEANAALREKGYTEAQLAAYEAPLPGKALLKGNKILSPFADTPETVLRAAREFVPAAAELGRRQLTPHELRAAL